MKTPIKRKGIFFTLASFTILTNVTLTECNSSTSKTENVQSSSTDTSNKTSDTTNAKYINDMETYKKQMADTIALIDKKMDEFKAKVDSGSEKVKVEYKKDIADLEQRGRELKKKLDEYQAKGKDKWEAFKKDFTRDMDTLSRQLKDLTSKKDKA